MTNEERKLYNKQYYNNNKEKYQQLRIENREKNKKYLKEYYINNREKSIEYQKKYNIINKEKNKKRDEYRHIKQYNITIEQYDDIFKLQEGKCHICGKHQNELKTKLCVDHNHKTNKVRGLLCDKCNRGLGHFNDDIEILMRAIDYLQKN